MLKDDRMMGMLTFVVIMIAVGTFIQRADFFQQLFGDAGAAPVLNADVAEARAGSPIAVNVLGNDSGVADRTALTITAPPGCGDAFVHDGEIRYRGDSSCLGTQTLRYGLGRDGPTAELRITVASAAEGSGTLRTVIRPDAPRTAEAGAESGTQTGTSARREGRAAVVARGQAPADPAVAAADPAAMAASGRQAASAAASAAPASGGAPAAASGAAGQPGRKCTLPPTLTVTAMPSAITEVAVDSPCDREVVAVLAYDGLRFAIPLNFRGAGSLEVPGFQRSTEATLTLERGGEIAFNLPFEGIERIDRVAIAWEASAALPLNAFEFGARPGGQGHLTPEAPGSFEAVRRAGGGWLASYAPEQGKGQHIDVYSFWRRHGGRSGVVKLALDPGVPAGSGLCAGTHPGERAGGTTAGADYVVLRSRAGALERSRLGRVAPLDCTVLAGGSRRYIENAVDDLIVRRR